MVREADEALAGGAVRLRVGMLGQDTRATLGNRVEVAKKAVGIVVGTISPDGREVFARGKVSSGGGDVGADSVFEIGSITKVFTSLLLADMIERGEVTADTPVAKLLPDSVKVPARNGKQITLLDLSMQVSGLPRMPNNFKPADPENPYADYTAAKLYEFLSGLELKGDSGEKYQYSNLGVGLLGHALARKAGKRSLGTTAEWRATVRSPDTIWQRRRL